MKKTFNYHKFQEQFQTRFAADVVRSVKTSSGYDVSKNLPDASKPPAAPTAPQPQGASAPADTSSKETNGTEQIPNIEQTIKKIQSSPELNKIFYELQILQSQYELAKKLFDSASSESKRVFETVPTFDPENPCQVKELISSTVSVKEVEKKFEDYDKFLNRYNLKNKEYIKKLESMSIETQQKLSQPGSKESLELKAIGKMIADQYNAKTELEFNAQILGRKYDRFSKIGPYQNSLYSIMSSICTLSTRYNYEKKLTGLGSNEVWRALLDAYVNALRLVQNMEIIARTQFGYASDEQNEIVAQQYAYYVEAFSAKINELSVEPAMASFGK